MRVLVCGGRKYDNAARVYSVLGRIHRETPISILLHGGALGADHLAGRWAVANDVACVVFPAKWEQYGRRAGPIRNALMLEENPSLVVAFQGGRGTADMVRRAKAAGVPVREIGEIQPSI